MSLNCVCSFYIEDLTLCHIFSNISFCFYLLLPLLTLMQKLFNVASVSIFTFVIFNFWV